MRRLAGSLNVGIWCVLMAISVPAEDVSFFTGSALGRNPGGDVGLVRQDLRLAVIELQAGTGAEFSEQADRMQSAVAKER